MESSENVPQDGNQVAASNGQRHDLTTRDAILAANDMRIERLWVPEWNGYVYLRTITGTQRDRFEASMLIGEKQTNDNVRAKFLVEALCDAGGQPIFSTADVEALGNKSAAGLTRCYNKASTMNALSNADVDELAGNSGGGAIVSS